MNGGVIVVALVCVAIVCVILAAAIASFGGRPASGQKPSSPTLLVIVAGLLRSQQHTAAGLRKQLATFPGAVGITAHLWPSQDASSYLRSIAPGDAALASPAVLPTPTRALLDGLRAAVGPDSCEAIRKGSAALWTYHLQSAAELVKASSRASHVLFIRPDVLFCEDVDWDAALRALETPRRLLFGVDGRPGFVCDFGFFGTRETALSFMEGATERLHALSNQHPDWASEQFWARALTQIRTEALPVFSLGLARKKRHDPSEVAVEAPPAVRGACRKAFEANK